MPTGIYKRTKEQYIKIGNANRGKKRSEATKERIRRARLGTHRLEITKKKISEALKGHPATRGTRGLKFSEETRKKMSDAHKGSLAYNWKGSVTLENNRIRNGIEFRLWREAVFARDNWICQKTKVKGGKLHPHHIKNFAQHPELRFAIDNGITLSEKAHREFHKRYGTKNNTQKQLEDFLKI